MAPGVLAVVVAGLDSFFDPALRASLPVLAGDVRTLRAANGLMDATRRLARIVGPGLAGVLATTLPVAHFFTLDALSFVVSRAAILSLWVTAPSGSPHGTTVPRMKLGVAPGDYSPGFVKPLGR